MRKRLFALSLLAGLACAAVMLEPSAYCQEQTLWQIGRFDQSSEDFGVSFGFGPLTSAPTDPVYRVGQSDWKKDWVGFQPGSANALAGGREHPFTVIFSLDAPPRGLYKLTIGLLPYMPRRPNLSVKVNGKYGHGYAVARKELSSMAWVFESHFYRDPVMPGTMMIEGLLQLAGFCGAYAGGRGRGRAARIDDIRFLAEVTPADKEIFYRVDVRKCNPEHTLVVAEGKVTACGTD